MSDLRQQLGLQEHSRYPLAYLMEAADDISYCLADIEDGVEKGLLSYHRLADLLTTTFDAGEGKADIPWFNSEGKKPKSFREVINYVTGRADKEPINKAHEFCLAQGDADPSTGAPCCRGLYHQY